MRTTLALDDELMEQAQAYTGIAEKSALVREALMALVQREAARRLARSEPGVRLWTRDKRLAVVAERAG